MKKAQSRMKGTPPVESPFHRDTVTLMSNLKASDFQPLDLLLAVIRDDTLPVATRVDAAKSAAPYLHKKQPTIIEGGEKPLFEFSPEELRALSKAELGALKLLLSKMGADLAPQSSATH